MNFRVHIQAMDPLAVVTEACSLFDKGTNRYEAFLQDLVEEFIATKYAGLSGNDELEYRSILSDFLVVLNCEFLHGTPSNQARCTLMYIAVLLTSWVNSPRVAMVGMEKLNDVNAYVESGEAVLPVTEEQHQAVFDIVRLKVA